MRQRQLRHLWLGLAAAGVGAAVLAWLAWLLRRRSRQLEAQRQALAALNATKDRLFSVIGHDLRAPLHSLHTFVELLSGPPLPPERLGHYTRHLTQTLDHTTLLLENLLSWATLQLRPGPPPPPHPVPLAAAATDALDLLHPTAAAAGLELPGTVAGPGLVLADPQVVRLVLRNLLSNAIRFTPAGGRIALAITHPPGRPGCWQLAVADTGQGLPTPTPRQPLRPALLPRRAGPGTAPSAGLGLALCLDYVQRYDGSLEVESPGPGQGTTFYLLLPAAEEVGE